MVRGNLLSFTVVWFEVVMDYHTFATHLPPAAQSPKLAQGEVVAYA